MDRYYDYLNSLKNVNKIEWTKKIVNTNMDVLAIPIPKLKSIVKDIMKNDYISFLDLKLLDNYESTIIYAEIINNLKDINLIKKYLDIYVNYIDNWSSCDVLSIKVGNKDKNKLYNIAKKYLNNKKPFVRRVGFRILFKYLDDINYVKDILSNIDKFCDEEHYYVNMIIAWLLCEIFIKQRNIMLDYLDTHNLNDFVINKMISKCRDSYRVSIEDKDMLLKYKR